MKSNQLLLCSIVATLFSISLSAQTCFSSWNYSQEIIISNPNSTTLDSHQVAIIINTADLISNNKLSATGSDLRFSLLGCCQEIPYYIDSAMNTVATKIWIKVPAIAANSATSISMYYGNTAANSVSSPNAVFDLYDDFNGNSLTSFTNTCNQNTYSHTVGGSSLTLNWTSSSIYTSNKKFASPNNHLIEAKVNSASGDWPGIYWFNDNSTNQSYAILQGVNSVKTSLSGSGSGFCQGHNWASPLYPKTVSAGIWSIVWLNNDKVITTHPSVALPIVSTNPTYMQHSQMVVGIGGISSGVGTMAIDWIRVRKYAALNPITNIGPEIINYSNILALDTIEKCTNISQYVNANIGFTGHSWSSGSVEDSSLVPNSGYLYVNATNSIGCLITDSIWVNELQVPVSAFTSNATTQTLNVGFTNSSTGADTYNWTFGDGTNSTNSDPIHTYATQGTYTVCLEAISANNCTQTTCTDITVGTLSVNDKNSSIDLQIYPNPTTENIQINFTNTQKNVKISVLDMNGKTLLSKNAEQVGPVTISVKHLSAGSYILKVSSKESESKHVFIKK